MNLTYQQCLDSEDLVSPQDLPGCSECLISIRDCERLTSVEKCGCPYYSNYKKEWKNNEKKKRICK